MPRKRHVSRNTVANCLHDADFVMPRKRHVSRNEMSLIVEVDGVQVMPRKRHVSRNTPDMSNKELREVMPRKRHVSRNDAVREGSFKDAESCLARGM